MSPSTRIWPPSRQKNDRDQKSPAQIASQPQIRAPIKNFSNGDRHFRRSEPGKRPKQNQKRNDNKNSRSKMAFPLSQSGKFCCSKPAPPKNSVRNKNSQKQLRISALPKFSPSPPPTAGIKKKIKSNQIRKKKSAWKTVGERRIPVSLSFRSISPPSFLLLLRMRRKEMNRRSSE